MVASIVCLECLSGYNPTYLNNTITSCDNACGSYPQFRDIINKEVTDFCKISQWAAVQIDLSAYDMVNNNPRPTSSDELSALRSFYTYLNGQIWENNDNWLIGDPCLNYWYGIMCNSRGNIISIHLKQNRLYGVIPDTIKLLKYLRYIYIYNHPNENSYDNANFIFQVPKEITYLPNLKEVIIKNVNTFQYLSQDNFNFGPSLEILDLSHNRFNSTLSFGGNLYMQNLKRINLSNNNFYGSIISLNFLIKLEIIELQNNFFSEDIPLLNQLTNLKVLDLRNNSFTGDLNQNYFKQSYFVSLEYIGVMLNLVNNIPEPCRNSSLCYNRMLQNVRSIDDPVFELTSTDLMYLIPKI
jgi:hypothetical protein